MTRFLQEATLQAQGRRRLREIMLVLLRMGSLLFALGALARPYAPFPFPLPPAPTAVVLIIDTSLSMHGGHPKGKWFQGAKAWCRRLIAEVPSRFAILSADTPYRPICPFTDEKSALFHALRRIRLTPKSLDLTAALRFADALLKTQTAVMKRILIVTDLQSEPFRSLSFPPLRHPLIVIDVKGEGQVGNGRMSAFVRLPLDPKTDGTVTVRAQNFSFLSLPGTVTLYIAGRPIAQKQITLFPESVQECVFPLPAWVMAVKTETVRGEVQWSSRPKGKDVFSLDDQIVFAFRTPFGVRPIVALKEGRPFIMAALKETGLKPVAGSLKDLRDGDVVITGVPRSLEATERFVAWVKGGKGAVVFVTRIPSPLWDLLGIKEPEGREGKWRRCRWVDETGALLEGLGKALQTVRVKVTGRFFVPLRGGRVWATFDDGTPFLWERRVGQGLIVFVMSPLDDRSNFPFTPVFVPLMRRLTLYAAYKGAFLRPKERETFRGEGMAVFPEAESDFRLPDKEALKEALRERGGTLWTAQEGLKRIFELVPLRDLFGLTLFLALLCLLLESLLTALWWRHR